MKLTTEQYKNLCQTCPYLKRTGTKRVCVYGVGCVKKEGERYAEVETVSLPTRN